MAGEIGPSARSLRVQAEAGPMGVLPGDFAWGTIYQFGEKDGGVSKASFAYKNILFTSSRKGIKRWDMATGKSDDFIPASSLPGLIHALAVAEGTIWACAGDGKVALFDLTTGAPRDKAFAAHQGEVLSIAVGPGGKYIATGGVDFLVKTWHPSTGALIASSKHHRAGVECLLAVPDLPLDPANTREEPPRDRDGGGEGEGAGGVLWTAASDGSVFRFSDSSGLGLLSAGETSTSFKLEGGKVRCMASHQSSVYVGMDDGRIHVLRSKDASPERVIRSHQGPVLSLASVGECVWSGSGDRSIQVHVDPNVVRTNSVGSKSNSNSVGSSGSVYGSDYSQYASILASSSNNSNVSVLHSPLFSLGDQGGYVKSLHVHGWWVWALSSGNAKVFTAQALFEQQKGVKERLQRLLEETREKWKEEVTREQLKLQEAKRAQSEAEKKQREAERKQKEAEEKEDRESRRAEELKKSLTESEELIKNLRADSSATAKQLQDQLADVEAQKQALEGRLKAADHELAVKKDENQALEAELKRLNEEIKKAEQMRREVEAGKRGAEEERGQVERELNKVKERAEKAEAEAVRVDAERKRLEEEKGRVEGELEKEAREGVVKGEEWERRRREFEEEMQRMKREEEEKAKRIATLEREVKDAKEGLELETSSAASHSAAAEDLKRQLEDLKTQLESERSKNNQAVLNASDADAALKKLQEEANTFKAQRDDSNSQLTASRRELEDMKRRWDLESKTQREKEAAAAMERDKLLQKIQEAEGHLDNLRRKEEETKVASSTVASDFNSRIAAAEVEAGEERRKREILEAELEEERRRREEAAEAAEKAAIAAETAAARSDAAEALTQKIKNQHDDAQNRIDTLQRQLSDESSARQNVEAQHRTLTEDHDSLLKELHKLKEQYEKALSERAEVEASFRGSATAAEMQASVSAARAHEAEEKLKGMEESFRAMERSLKEAEEKLREVRDQKEEDKKLLAESRADATAAKNALASRVKELEEQLREAREKLAAAAAEAAALQAAREATKELNEEILRLKTRVADLEERKPNDASSFADPKKSESSPFAPVFNNTVNAGDSGIRSGNKDVRQSKDEVDDELSSAQDVCDATFSNRNGEGIRNFINGSGRISDGKHGGGSRENDIEIDKARKEMNEEAEQKLKGLEDALAACQSELNDVLEDKYQLQVALRLYKKQLDEAKAAIAANTPPHSLSPSVSSSSASPTANKPIISNTVTPSHPSPAPFSARPKSGDQAARQHQQFDQQQRLQQVQGALQQATRDYEKLLLEFAKLKKSSVSIETFEQMRGERDRLAAELSTAMAQLAILRDEIMSWRAKAKQLEESLDECETARKQLRPFVSSSPPPLNLQQSPPPPPPPLSAENSLTRGRLRAARASDEVFNPRPVSPSNSEMSGARTARVTGGNRVFTRDRDRVIPPTGFMG
uniref:Uncharacterized protein n=2 Tax=Polytomella parva TaxID=51329 RepID=A0A7S0YDC5_9CHLO|mmetsp:Transcript_1946/g.2895  ORF Transcript_1946/g.2895 Transcript_1946/m.2895 type:complete len:1440 (+) Transcript_1946:281-4600(+)